MPKKSRRSKVKHRTRTNPRPLATIEAGRHTQSLLISSRQAAAHKSSKVTIEQAGSHALAEVKRSLIIGGAVITLLIVLSFLLR